MPADLDCVNIDVASEGAQKPPLRRSGWWRVALYVGYATLVCVALRYGLLRDGQLGAPLALVEEEDEASPE